MFIYINHYKDITLNILLLEQHDRSLQYQHVKYDSPDTVITKTITYRGNAADGQKYKVTYNESGYNSGEN